MKNLFIVFIFLISQTSAQSNINFSHLSVNNGLSHTAVTCIFQDKLGFMWFGTQDGLNRYDGYNFKVFKNNPDNKNSLTDNFIYSIYENDSGTLYIVTQSGNIHEYNPVKESFKLIPSDKINLTGYRASSILAFYFDKDKNIEWSGGLSQALGLKCENKSTGEVKIFKNNPYDNNSLSNDKVYSVFRDSKGILWVGTAGGLDQFNESTGKFLHYRNEAGNPHSLSDNFVWPIFEDSKGNVWIGTGQGGLNRYDRNSGNFYSFINDKSNPKSISDNYIYSLYEDRSGIIWVGTSAGGVNYFHPSAQAFQLYRKNPELSNTLSDDMVFSLHVDKDGRYWIGTSSGGIDLFDPKRNVFINYSNKPGTNSIISNTITAIAEDKFGILWFGSFNSGLSSFDPQRGIFRNYVNNPGDINSLSDNRVYSLLADNYGDIWVGTYGGGLNKLDRKTQKFTRFQYDKEDDKSLSSNSVFSITEDKSGIIWIGTFGGGINKFNKKDSYFTHFRNNAQDPESIADDRIIRVFIDSKNNLWFGTLKGLSRYYRETNKFKSWREHDGLPNEYIYGILEDKDGNLWLSTNKGLSRFNPVSEVFKNYYSEDGLQGNEFNQNAFAKNNLTGELLFGGTAGFNVFDPELLAHNKFVPPIVFTNYLRYNSDDEEGKPIIEKGITHVKNINLTYKDNIVAFEFSALSYYNSRNNQYRYKLEGFNDNWIQLGYENKITFTNLSPGNYTLKVSGSNNDGVWNETGAYLSMMVTPPWWKTNIAYSVYIILFVGIMYGLRKFELNQKEQKARIRESELHLKATEAEKRALQIENDRKTKELEEARQLQLSMLPKKLPILPHLEFGAYMRTATEVGGDYYDFRVQDNEIVNVALGDATGHGLQAGTMVTLMKGFFTSDSKRLGLQEFMTECSTRIKDIELGRILMSFTYLKIDNNKVYIANAGMPPIYLYHCETNEIEEIMISGLPLGAMRNVKYKMLEKELRSGDILFLLTDGLPEQMNEDKEMFDYSRVKGKFCEVVKYSPDEIIHKIVEEGDNWMKGVPQTDDITLVVIKVK